MHKRNDKRINFDEKGGILIKGVWLVEKYLKRIALSGLCFIPFV